MRRYNAAFITPTGEVVPLHDPVSGLTMTGQIIGGGMPTVTHTAEPIFDQPGEDLINSRFNARVLDIPISLRADDGDMLRERERALVRRLNPMAGFGTLRITRQDGTGRIVPCRYAGGLEGDTETKDWGPMWEEHLLSFRCFDPYFTDAVDNEVNFTATAASRPFFPFATGPTDFGPYFGSSTVFENASIENTGDGFAYPVWRIDGPATSPVLLNTTTGEKLDFTADGGLTIVLGDALIIDTHGTIAIARLLGGENVLHHLTDESSLWPLVPGENLIALTVPGSTNATNVRFQYGNRYLHL